MFVTLSSGWLSVFIDTFTVFKILQIFTNCMNVNTSVPYLRMNNIGSFVFSVSGNVDKLFHSFNDVTAPTEQVPLNICTVES